MKSSAMAAAFERAGFSQFGIAVLAFKRAGGSEDEAHEIVQTVFAKAGAATLPRQTVASAPTSKVSHIRERATRLAGKVEAALVSKYKCYDGRPWSEVGWHELPSMARQGNEAAALLAAGPASVPNDGRSLGKVLPVRKIDEIIEASRS